MNLVLQRGDAPATPAVTVKTLPPNLLNQVAERSCWAALLAAGSILVFALFGAQLQTEFSVALSRPWLRLNLLGALFLSMAFFLIQRSERLSNRRKVDLGSAFQVLISFAIAMFETALPWNSADPVRGKSGIAIWLVLCGFLLPNAPLKAGIAAALSIACWPLAYWINLAIYHFEPLPWQRLVAWNLANVLTGVWMFFINRKVIAMEMKQIQAEELGSYELIEPIAQGGMGEVWRARHRLLARDAAIKIIRRDVLQASSGSEGALVVRRFEREAQVTAKLQSPHTVALYDFGQAKDGSFYYVMEMLNGIDLQLLVDRFGPVNPGRVVNIMIEACESLEEAHQAGLVHRDIKPLNILLCTLGLRYDFVKVLDFGLVKTRARAGQTLATADGLATGTPGYIAPEAAMGSPDLDARADLYSLGCVAYFMLTGHMVFEEPSSLAQAIAHVQKQPIPLSERTEIPVPRRLEKIVMQLLAKDPNDRIPSAYELARRLRALVEIPPFCPYTAAEWWNTNLPNNDSITRMLTDIRASRSGIAQRSAEAATGVAATRG